MIRADFVRRASALAIVLGMVVSFSPATANDAKVEAAAKKLQTDAMDVDFLSLDYKKAKKKLDEALKKCGKDKCSKPLYATLQRDLGIVLHNSGDHKGGAKAFSAAFTADPSVTIAKDYLDNAELRKAWEAARKKAGVSAPAPEEPAKPPPEAAPGGAEGGLIVKSTLAPIGYELPIVITVPAGLEVAAVKVSYKTDDMEKYKVIEAKKQSGKWVATLPCDVTQKAGTLKLYAKAYDDGNGEIEHWGTIKKPAQIKLVDSMPDDVESPTLPGGKEPKECGAAGGSEEGGGSNKPEGAGCKEDDECEKGLICIENDAGKKWCQKGDKKPKNDQPKLWFGLDGQLDVVFLGAEKDLCKQSTWACSVDNATHLETDGSISGIGRQDITTSSTQGIRVGDTGGKTDGGAAFATKRIFASLDYFVGPRLSLGARIGYAFGGNPTSSAKFVPLHLEARMQYFVADGPFRPYFLLAGGFMRTDPPVPNVIVEPNDPTYANACNQGGDPYGNPQCGGSTSGSRPVIKNVTAYKLAGPGFAAAGIGAWVMATDKIAVNLAAKFVFPVPVFAPTFSPEIGMKFGF